MNLTTGKVWGVGGKPASLCVHDGSPDDGSAPQLVKGWGVCYRVYMIGAHNRTCGPSEHA